MLEMHSPAVGSADLPPIDWSDLDNHSSVPQERARNGNGRVEDSRSSFLPSVPGNEERALYADVAAILDGNLAEPPAPTVLRRTDGVGLFYAAQVNWVYGDPESGKTLLATAAAAEALRDGLRVLILDLDHNGAAATVGRLLSFGAPEAALRTVDQFRYAEPDDATELGQVIADVCGWQPTVAVVDSVGELLPLLNLSSNSPDDFTFAHSRVLKPIAKAGAAVIAIDHLAKSLDSRAQGPTGTAAKRRAIGGSAIRVTVVRQFTPGSGGSAALAVNKDRHGGLRARCPIGDKEPLAGMFLLSEHDDGTFNWKVTKPELGESAPLDGVSDGDLARLDALDPPPASVDDVKTRLRIGTNRAMLLLRAWRSRVPGDIGEERGTGRCRNCGQPLDPALDADETHPNCAAVAR